MAGCVAGIISGNATILEAGDAIPNNHQALLRFRTDNLSKITGIPFQKVKVFKGIWMDGKEQPLSPRMINLYGQKVIGCPTLRSIGSLDTVDRYVAPKDFHAILGQMLGDRIQFQSKVESINKVVMGLKSIPAFFRTNIPIISTMPMPVLARLLGKQEWLGQTLFKQNKIYVSKAQITDAKVYQTIYYPSPDFNAYRASMSGNTLIIEGMDEVDLDEMKLILESFGLDQVYTWESVNQQQSMGKIAPIPDHIRKDFMFKASTEFNVWSLGRFACWRNILLDDVYHDIFKIRSMIEKDHYTVRLNTQG